MEFSGLLLLFMLGMRHGFDPDHIAIIDGVSVRYSVTKPSLAKWTGTLFALGHGSVVTCIAVMISRISHSWRFPQMVWDILDWVPGIILIGVSIMNLRLLQSKKTYQPAGLKTFLLPKGLKDSSNPLAIVLIGMLFAMVFDTNTQAAAWAYTATSTLNTINALLLGCSFSAGMIITDTLDSRILYSLLLRSADGHAMIDYRRVLGWVIVCVSLLVGGYKLLVHVLPFIEMPENMLTLTGILFFALMALFYTYIIYTGYLASKKQINGH